MQVHRIQNNNETSFYGYLKFKNRTIDANDIEEFATKTIRRALTPRECPKDEFIWNAVGCNTYNYRYYDEAADALDWMQVRMKIGNDPSAVSITGSQHEVAFHDGIIDFIKGKLKMKNGKKFTFEFPRIVAPPTLSELNIYSGIIERFRYQKAPVPKDILTIDELIAKARKEDGVFRIDTELEGNFFNMFKSETPPPKTNVNPKIQDKIDEDKSLFIEYIKSKLKRYGK